MVSLDVRTASDKANQKQVRIQRKEVGQRWFITYDVDVERGLTVGRRSVKLQRAASANHSLLTEVQ